MVVKVLTVRFLWRSSCRLPSRSCSSVTIAIKTNTKKQDSIG